VSFIVFLVILSPVYPWLSDFEESDMLVNRILPPHGFARVPAAHGSFAEWLRSIPLKPGNPPVTLFNGQPKPYQAGHHAVIDIDIGTQDLQQCADAIIRLCAEYLLSRREYDKIVFLLTNGDTVAFTTWSTGYRPHVVDDVVTWQKEAHVDSSYTAFRHYLDFVFTYAGTYSLGRQLSHVDEPQNVRAGDVFIRSGFPGHAVLVVDVAINERTEERAFLLCQSYMPAQDIHILANLKDPDMSPWYTLGATDTLSTPEWTFLKNDVKRF
jgi:hypothetical protein